MLGPQLLPASLILQTILGGLVKLQTYKSGAKSTHTICVQTHILLIFAQFPVLFVLILSHTPLPVSPSFSLCVCVHTLTHTHTHSKAASWLFTLHALVCISSDHILLCPQHGQQLLDFY
jgi:hypothetical protein